MRLSYLILIALIFLQPSKLLAKSSFENVALVSVSTQFDEDNVASILEVFKNKGYNVTTKYLKQFPFQDLGYTNAESVRAATLLQAMKDPNIDIIWFVRGGGGGFNIVPYLKKEESALKKLKPKIIVGFSDVTAVHLFVNNNLNWISVHGTVAGLNKDLFKIDPPKAKNGETIFMNDREPLADVKSIFMKGLEYDNIIPLNDLARKGVTSKLIGGNLTLVYSTFSTKYEPEWKGKILFVEDVGVSFRQLDRNLHQLLYKKDFNVKGIVFGRTFPLKPTTEQILIYKVALQKFAKKFKKPVYYYPVIGHGRKNKPLLLNHDAKIICMKEDYYCKLKQEKVVFFQWFQW